MSIPCEQHWLIFQQHVTPSCDTSDKDGSNDIGKKKHCLIIRNHMIRQYRHNEPYWKILGDSFV